MFKYLLSSHFKINYSYLLQNTYTHRHKFRHKETYSHSNSDTDKHSDILKHRHRDMLTNTNTHVRTHTNTHTHSNIHIQTHRDTKTYSHSNTDTDTHLYTLKHTFRHTQTQNIDTQTWKHTWTSARSSKLQIKQCRIACKCCKGVMIVCQEDFYSSWHESLNLKNFHKFFLPFIFSKKISLVSISSMFYEQLVCQ